MNFGIVIFICLYTLQKFYRHKKNDSTKIFTEKYTPNYNGRKVFALGWSKTGTTSLSMELEHNLGIKCCHWMCEDNRFWTDYKEKDDYLQYDCYIDPGKNVDFKLLHAMFPDAIFIMTTRAIDTWAASMYRHVRGNRLKLNCTEKGDESDCKWDNRPETEWRNNKWLTTRIKKFIQYYMEMKTYFNNTNQFHILSIEDYSKWNVQLSNVFNTTFNMQNFKFSYSTVHDYPLTKSCIQEGVNIYKKICQKQKLHSIPRLCYNYGRENKLQLKIPSVLIVGTQKGGTTALQKTLENHPEIQMYPNEIHYFDTQTEQTLTNYESFLKTKEQPTNKKGIIIEKTPRYFKSLNKIKEIMPRSTKIIILARNPVERFFSAFLHGKKDQWPNWPQDINECLNVTKCKDLYEFGFYTNTIKRFSSEFDNIFVGIYENMWSSTYDWSSMQQFLNLSQPIHPIKYKTNQRKSKEKIPKIMKEHLEEYYKPKSRHFCKWLKEHNKKCPFWSN